MWVLCACVCVNFKTGRHRTQRRSSGRVPGGARLHDNVCGQVHMWVWHRWSVSASRSVGAYGQFGAPVHGERTRGRKLRVRFGWVEAFIFCERKTPSRARAKKKRLNFNRLHCVDSRPWVLSSSSA